MPQRGMRSIWPPKGRKPTGIFGQPQKNDGDGNAPNKGAKEYAHSRKCRENGHSRPKCAVSTNKNLRHQKPAAGKSKNHGRMKP